MRAFEAGKEQNDFRKEINKNHVAMCQKWNNKFVDGRKTVTETTMSTVRTAQNIEQTEKELLLRTLACLKVRHCPEMYNAQRESMIIEHRNVKTYDNFLQAKRNHKINTSQRSPGATASRGLITSCKGPRATKYDRA